VAVDVLDLADATFNGALPTGMAAVQATSLSVVGYLQTIKLTGGTSNSYSTISATVVFADGTQLTRGFRCLVR
jgi:undecaprenyl pyrophosphate phosphatase UppP